MTHNVPFHTHALTDRFLDPSDREHYLYRLQEVLYTDTHTISDICKVGYRDDLRRGWVRAPLCGVDTGA